jgi:hypothetical protein
VIPTFISYLAETPAPKTVRMLKRDATATGATDGVRSRPSNGTGSSHLGHDMYAPARALRKLLRGCGKTFPSDRDA